MAELDMIIYFKKETTDYDTIKNILLKHIAGEVFLDSLNSMFQFDDGKHGTLDIIGEEAPLEFIAKSAEKYLDEAMNPDLINYNRLYFEHYPYCYANYNKRGYQILYDKILKQIFAHPDSNVAAAIIIINYGDGPLAGFFSCMESYIDTVIMMTDKAVQYRLKGTPIEIPDKMQLVDYFNCEIDQAAASCGIMLSKKDNSFYFESGEGGLEMILLNLAFERKLIKIKEKGMWK